MNDPLTDAVDNFLDSAQDPLKAIKDYLVDETPTAIQQEAQKAAEEPSTVDTILDVAKKIPGISGTATAVDMLKDSEFSKTFQGSVSGANPKMAGAFLDAQGVLFDNSQLSDTGRKLYAMGEANMKSLSPRVPSYKNIRNDSVAHFIDDAWDYVQGSAGSGIGTTMAPLGLGAVAGAPGAMSASFILNAGDAYDEARKDPEIIRAIEAGVLTPKKLAGLSMTAGAGMAFFDGWGALSILGQFTRPWKMAFAKHIIKGGITEATTESIQQAVSLANREVLGGDIKTSQAVEEIVNSFLGGAISGGVMGGTLGAAAPSRTELLQERMNALGQKYNPPYLRGIEALLNGENQVVQDAAVPARDLETANENKIFETVEPSADGKMLVFGEYLDAADAEHQAKLLRDIGRNVKVQPVPATDAERYNAAVERQITRRGTRNAFRVIRPDAQPQGSRFGIALTPEQQEEYDQLEKDIDFNTKQLSGVEGLTGPQYEAKRSAFQRKIDELGKKKLSIEQAVKKARNAPLGSTLESQEPELFYSQVQRAVEDKKFPNKGRGRDLLNKLKNSPGVKADELEWVVQDFLNTDEQVTKQDLIAHLEDNQIALSEFRYGLNARGRGFPEEPGGTTETGQALYHPDIWAQRAGMDRFEGATGSIPVDEVDYGELVFTWAPQMSKEARGFQKQLNELDVEFNKRFPVDEEGNTPPGFWEARKAIYETPEYRHADKTVYQARQLQKSQQYNELSEFPRGAIGWSRFSIARDFTGQLVLIVHEIQSRWHGRGRHKGYSKGNPQYRLVTKNGVTKFVGTEEVVRAELKDMLEQRPTEYKDAIVEPTGEVHFPDDKVPDAPFKTSWQDLVIKRIIRYAADKGIRKIAFPTGKLAADNHAGNWLQSTDEQGIINLWDKIMPPVIRKWAKAVGATVQTEAFPTGPAPTKRSGDMPWVTVMPDGRAWDFYNTREEAQDEADIVERQFDRRLVVKETAEWDDVVYQRQLERWLEGNRMPTIELPEKALLPANKPSFPRFSKLGGEGRVKYEHTRLKRLADQAEKLLAAVDLIAQKMGITENYSVWLLNDFKKLEENTPNANTYMGLYWSREDLQGDDPVLAINMSLHDDIVGVWTTITHEFGHLVADTALRKADTKTLYAISNAYEAHRLSFRGEERERQIQERTWSAGRVFALQTWVGRASLMRSPQFRSLAKDAADYLQNFPEWFAEQVSMWMQTEAKPVSIADNFFYGLAKRLKKMLRFMREKFPGRDFRPDAAVREWLDSFLKERPIDGAFFLYGVARDSMQANINALDAVNEGLGGRGYPQSANSQGSRLLVSSFPDLPPTTKASMLASAAHVDRITWAHRYIFGLREIQENFRHIQAVQEYAENSDAQRLLQEVLTDRAQVVREAWDTLKADQSEALANLLEDFANMVYRTPDEVKNKVNRMPTRDEFNKLARDAGVGPEGREVFKKIFNHWYGMMNLWEKILLDIAARRHADPTMAQMGIMAHFHTVKQTPMRFMTEFGRHVLDIRDGAGNLVQREFYENPKARDKALFELNRKFAGTQYKATARELSKQAMPFINFPTAVQKAILSQMELEPVMEADLKFMAEGSPTPQFQHRLRNKKNDPKYEQSLKRSFAWFSIRGATYVARLKFNDILSGNIKQLRDEAAMMPDGALRDGLADWLADHKKEQFSNRYDFAALRAAGFHMYLGFMVPSALINLTQAAFGTFPFLASKFGPKAAYHILKNGAQTQAYYRKGTLQGMTEPKWKALNRAVFEKIVDESQAIELAALAEGNNMLDRTNLKGAAKLFVNFKKLSAAAFGLAEKLLRRNAFLSTWDLVHSDPANPFVAESIRMGRQKFEQLRNEGWTVTEAAAYVTAVRTVNNTQFDYSRGAQPKLMRGPGRAVFMFKRFQHATLFMLYNHPRSLLYWLPMMLFFGGFMGIPGMEDLKGIAKALAWMIFGKDFDIEKEARKFMIDALGTDHVTTDLVIDGISKYGFGIPHMVDMLGGAMGTDIPFPTLDRSRALGLGNIIPVEFDRLFGPKTDPRDAGFDQLKRASGPLFGWFFDAYRALSNLQAPFTDKGTINRVYEPLLPKVLSRANQAIDAALRGGVTNQQGEIMIPYNIRDPHQRAELIAKAMGYTPLRESQKYEQVRKEGEAIRYWDYQKQLLLDQYWMANLAQDGEEKKRIVESIRAYNKSLPPEAKGKAITFGASGTLQRSMRARQQSKLKRETGKALRKQDQPLIDEIRRLYPGSNPVSVQKVR